MIESMRAYGYTIQAAIADIIDNSISAQAENIWLRFHWEGSASYISILDDGCGMQEDELRNAMRAGSQNPLESRQKHDLGRFGLGLKTASFSQCRCLTVTSKTNHVNTSTRRWDLDYVSKHNEWRLLKFAKQESVIRLNPLENQKNGTLILWENLDRVVGNANVVDKKAFDRFYKMIDIVEQHIAMVFHRYLEGPRAPVKIYINGEDDQHRIQPWDPFFEIHPATISTPEEPIPIANDLIKVKGFVLPHKDKLEPKQHLNLSGPRGWNDHQGFYVYRGMRMLVSGSWLSLGSGRPWTKEEHYKLARIRIDLPNSMDGLWQIDVKKSTANPPPIIRIRLKELAEKVRSQAREVYAHRGSYRKGNKSPVVRAWKPVTQNGRIHYKIDRQHPLVKNILTSPNPSSNDVKALLRIIEETVPIQQIWLDAAEKPETHSQPFEGSSEGEIRALIKTTYESLLNQEMTPYTARNYLSNMDGFKNYKAIIETLGD